MMNHNLPTSLLVSLIVIISFLLMLIGYSFKYIRSVYGKNRETGSNPSKSIVSNQENQSKKAKRNRILFEEMNEIVIQRELYLNPDLSRNDLLRLIHVDKNDFGKILQQCTGTNMTTYINNKRLEYATKMLKEHSEYTINSIAQSSGIPNVPTFNRLFRAKFGITPAEFRDHCDVS